MDRVLNSRKDKQSIYEIYRACRLCGAGAGYKMPIIQNVIDLDDQDVELKQKIRECVQIEVHQDDKMPPLICELCVDKVNDFYEFLAMCRQTNIRTRLRLGLPPQSMPRGAPDAGDCILGITEPVYVNSDSDGEPLAKHKEPVFKAKDHHSKHKEAVKSKESNVKFKDQLSKSQESRTPKHQQKSKHKKETEVLIKVESYVPPKHEPRTTRQAIKREPTPPRVTRLARTSKDLEDISVNKSQDSIKPTKQTKSSPKSILKNNEMVDDTSLLIPRLKRPRNTEVIKIDTPIKKVKIAAKPPPPVLPKTSPRTRAPPPPPPPPPTPPPPPQYTCDICHMDFRTSQALASHVRCHTAGYTNTKLACNACAEWFVTPSEALAHHKRHKSRGQSYHCNRCGADFKTQYAFDDHQKGEQCIPWTPLPDEKCNACWRQFPTANLLLQHRCRGEAARPGGNKCSKCRRRFTLLQNLRRHEKSCKAKTTSQLIVDPEVMARLKPMQVRIARCDSLLANVRNQHVDVSAVAMDYGLDKTYEYPYITSVSSIRIKTEPQDPDSMVSIKQEVKDEFCTEEDYVHWDSPSDTDSECDTGIVLNPFAKRKRIDTLSTMSLKTLFSRRCLGKVPKKRRKVKTERGFDVSNDDDVRRDINDIIKNLGSLDDSNYRDGDESPDIFNMSRDDGGKWDSNVMISFAGNVSVEGNDKDVENIDNSMKDVVNDAKEQTNVVTVVDGNDMRQGNDKHVGVNGFNDDEGGEKVNDAVKNVVNEAKEQNSDVNMVDSNDTSREGKEDTMDNENGSIKSDCNNDSSKNDSNHSIKGDLLKDDGNDLTNDSNNAKNDASDNSIKQDSASVDHKSDSTENGGINSIITHNNDSSEVAIHANGVTNHQCNNDDNDVKKIEDNDIERRDDNNDSKDHYNDLTSSPANGVETRHIVEPQNDVLNAKVESLDDINKAVTDGNDSSTTVNDSNRDSKYLNSSNNVSETTNVQNSNLNSNNINGSEENSLDNNINSLSEVDDRITPPNDVRESNDNTGTEKHDNAENLNSADNLYTTPINLSNDMTNCSNHERFDVTLKHESKSDLATNDDDVNDMNDKSRMEDDDRRLMEELDAQIGENDTSHRTSDDTNDKISLKDLIETKHVDHSLDLDNISDDEFNFDN